MNRPWQIWCLFGICFVLVAAGMGWLTLKVVQLERQERLLTVHAQFEGDVRLALWRMDEDLKETFAQESTWPHFAYQSFYLPDTQSNEDPFGSAHETEERPQVANASGGKSNTKDPTAESALVAPVASPLLVPANDFVKLYFQVDASKKVISPNVPPSEQHLLASRNGLTSELISQNKLLLEEFQTISDNNDLAALVPQLPSLASLQAAAAFSISDRQSPNQQSEQQLSGGQVAMNEPLANNSEQQSVENDPQQENLIQQGSAKPQGYAQSISPAEQARRGNLEYENRVRQVDKYVSNWNAAINQQKQLLNNPPYAYGIDNKTFMMGHSESAPVEGASRWLWINGELLLARQISIDNKNLIQGCWLDWGKIKTHLTRQVADLLPDVQIAPVFNGQQVDLTRLLATLPAQLVVTAPRVIGRDGLSPIHVSLIAAWICLALAAVAVVVLLAGVLSLSERRGAFVSAVTHELRTPLTTFRMYAEMLAEGMVPDESRRQQYLITLKEEADRLFHLIENVLSYARLEHGHGAGTKTTVTVAQLVRGMEQALTERAAQGEMELDVEVQDEATNCQVSTDVAAVEQIVMNLVDNACKYAGSASDRRIHMDARRDDGAVLLCVRDHGPGIARHESKRLFQPFAKSAQQAAQSAPGVGLGLALCRRMARQLGGRFYLEESLDDGAMFVLKLPVRTG